MRVRTAVAKNAEARTSLLTIEEQLALFNAIDALGGISTADELLRYTSGRLQTLLPHGRLVCGVGSIAGDRVKPYRMLSHNFPQQYIDELIRQDGTMDSPIMQRWRAKRKPLLVELERDRLGVALAYITRVKKYGFKNAAVHGLVDVQGAVTSYFCFIDIPENLGPRHEYLLALLVPHLHVALTRALAAEPNPPQALSAPPTTLSERQKDVLRWIYQGKTYWEIGQILGVSEDTIKYHVNQVFSKLSVSNRTQAVLKALSMDLIEK